MTDLPSDTLKLTQQYLKLKIMDDNISFRNHNEERYHVYDLMRRTVLQGESHSALIIGPQGSGKTTLVNSVLHQLAREIDLLENSYIVKLHGLIHTDDKIALKSITLQLQLENAVGDRVFGTFAENLAFLISCLQTGGDRRCKSMLFIIDHIDLFCKTGRPQTLLYNLFDITHSGESPVCVLGITNRADTVELLEKRVKSRFSHRLILLSNTPDGISAIKYYKQVIVELLSMPVRKVNVRGKKTTKSVFENVEFSIPDEIYQRRCINPRMFDGLDPSFVEDWNAHIAALVSDDKVTDAIEKFCYYTHNEQVLRNVLFQLVCKLRPSVPYIDNEELSHVIDNTVSPEHKVKMLHSLSIVELSLVVAMKHAMDIFDGQPLNFEMVLNRYTKFANANSTTQTVPRPVILKAFEHLQMLEIIKSAKNTDVHSNSETTASGVQKEYKLYTLAVPVETITEAVRTFKALPTEISHWYNNPIV